MPRNKLLDRAARLRQGNQRSQLLRIIDSTIHATGQTLVYNLKSQEAFYRLAACVRNCSTLLNTDYLNGARRLNRIKSIAQLCANLAQFRTRWIRKPELWQIADRGLKPSDQIRSLIDHLFVMHEVPRFMYQSWIQETDSDSRQIRNLFLHIAAGHSIRGSEIGKELTKEMVRRFQSAPHDATLEQAIRFARSGKPIKTAKQFPACTSRRRRKAWQRKLARSSVNSIDVKNFYYPTPVNSHTCSSRTWIIRQLTRRGQLQHEGKRLRHCVAAYWNDCIEGTSSIWTMESRDDLQTRGLLTIEIAPDRLEIVQIKGFENRAPRKHELDIIKLWCKMASLKIDSALLLCNE